ncbi:C-type lectin domain family 17, member A-like [Fundulus heteroclitus]|uniref:C-type lectin domain family 17, member A-like n=1 Tax=Fundulus heteroclitus TaxID=8078 RepID=UPI00165AD9C1|nr:C-type lectin domain family 17, member A-like [Fundulus heteroclitus]
MVLWILMSGVIIILAIYLPIEIIKVKKSISHLQAKLLGKWCPGGWTRFGSSCYCKYKETKSWSESRKHCQDRGSHLVIIDSPDEQEFVKELNENGESWIGLHYTRIEDTETYEWRWVDGSPLTQTYWATGLAQNPTYETNATCCNDEGKWIYPYNYTYYKNWICEK